jgi:tetraacyldisaccharide 4'-kinase
MFLPLTNAWVRQWRAAVVEKQPGPLFSLLRLCSRMISGPFSGITTVRRWLYSAGLLPVHTVPIRVISVGNITIGGTGKTPVVSLLASRLDADGDRPVILTRGYGRRSSEMVFLPSDTVSWEQAGDEPLMLSSALPTVPIVVYGDRVAAAQNARERFQPQVFLLDDGMQHLRMGRDLEIVVIDVTRPLESERVLPAGRLRENLRALRRADVFFLTRTDQSDDTEAVAEFLEKYHPAAMQIRSIFRPWALRALPAGHRQSLEILRDRPVLAVSGIGNPNSLERSLTHLGARLKGRLHFPDHYPYTRGDVELMEQRALHLGAQSIVTTEKDAVRLRGIDHRAVPFFALMVRIEIISHDEDFWRIVKGGS